MDYGKWEVRFLRLAREVSKWSKDPRTQVGAVIANKKEIVSIGYNGFPPGMVDLQSRLKDREYKHKFVIHAEENAILHAKRDLSGCVIYTWPFAPCTHCTSIVIKSGISGVVTVKHDKNSLEAKEILKEAGIITLYKEPNSLNND